MRYLVLIVMFFCLGCKNNSNDSNNNSNSNNENRKQINTELSQQRAQEIAILESRIKDIDLLIAETTKEIKIIPNRANKEREVVIIKEKEPLFDKLMRDAGKRGNEMAERHIEEENQRKYARIAELRSERELLMGKLMILYKIQQSRNVDNIKNSLEPPKVTALDMRQQ